MYSTFQSPKESYSEKAADFLAALLREGIVEAVGVPIWTPDQAPTYSLITQPEAMAAADPFAPVMLRNAADQLAEFTRQGLARPVAVVLRSCEMRALIELVKLKQAHLENVLLIGADCLGTVPLRTYDGAGRALTAKALAEPLTEAEQRSACRICGLRAPMAADIVLCALGVDRAAGLTVSGTSEKGREVLAKLGLTEAGEPAGRAGALDKLAAEAQTRLANTSANDLISLLGKCMRCYNCRDMCPICYCPECFFTSSKLGYNTDRYLAWAKRKGSLALPTDVLLFHITRMNHMITSCVGCGICEQACPNDIPLGRIFGVIRREAQAEYGYEAGRSLDESLPMSVFVENELNKVEE